MVPQKPYCEQQLPKVEPKQVSPVVPPQLPSVLIAVADTAGTDEVEEGLDVALAVGAEVNTLPPPRVRYQFAAGSPRQSPTVPNFQPCAMAVSTMYAVRLIAVCW